VMMSYYPIAIPCFNKISVTFKKIQFQKLRFDDGSSKKLYGACNF
jgi:hypothetical protein